MKRRRTIIFRPEAESEFAHAAQWYEENRRGLGSEFVRAVEAILEKLVRTPELFPEVTSDVRRALVKRFPFGVFYSFTETQAIVLAVFHARRDRRKITQRH